MKCPHDGYELVISDTEGHVGFHCPRCRGMWLPSKYLRSIKYTRQFSYEGFVQELQQETLRLGSRSCPGRCGELTEVNWRSITIDRCEHCEGIWFDGGELRRLISCHPVLPGGPGAKEAAVGFTVEALLAWLILMISGS